MPTASCSPHHHILMSPALGFEPGGAAEPSAEAGRRRAAGHLQQPAAVHRLVRAVHPSSPPLDADRRRGRARHRGRRAAGELRRQLTTFGTAAPARNSITCCVARRGRSVSASGEYQAACGERITPGSVAQRAVARQRLLLVDVERGARRPARCAAPSTSAASSTSGAAARVDEDRARAAGCASAAASIRWQRLGRQRQVQREHVGGREQLVQRRRCRPGVRGIVGEHAEAERARAARRRASRCGRGRARRRVELRRAAARAAPARVGAQPPRAHAGGRRRRRRATQASTSASVCATTSSTQ